MGILGSYMWGAYAHVLEVQEAKHSRKRASGSGPVPQQAMASKVGKRSSDNGDIRAARRLLDQMDKIKHTGQKADILRNQDRFMFKYIYNQHDPKVDDDEDELNGVISAEAAKASVAFWLAALTTGEALIMAVTLMPGSFDRVDKSKGRSLWFMPLVAGATRRLLLGSEVSCSRYFCVDTLNLLFNTLQLLLTYCSCV